jgi:hypothetical protein
VNDQNQDQDRAKAVALTTERLEALLRQTRVDEARLKRILELRRLKRRQRPPAFDPPVQVPA